MGPASRSRRIGSPAPSRQCAPFGIATLALLFALAIACAPATRGAEPDIIILGNAETSFGTFTQSDGSGTRDNLLSTIESNLRFRNRRYKNDRLYFELRLRARGRQVGGKFENTETFASGSLQTVRVLVGWNTTEQLALEIGRTAGLKAGYSDMEVFETPTALDSKTRKFIGSDAGSLNIIYRAGPLRGGVLILSRCNLDCGGDGGTIANPDDPAADAGFGNRTILPHVRATFGPVTLAARMAFAEGQYAKGDTPPGAPTTASKASTVRSHGAALSAAYAAGDLYLGFDYETFTLGCIGDPGKGGVHDCVEIIHNGWGLGFRAGKTYGHYYTESVTVQDAFTASRTGDSDAVQGDTADAVFQTVALGYRIPMGAGAIHPEVLASLANSGEKRATNVSVHSVRLGFALNF